MDVILHSLIMGVILMQESNPGAFNRHQWVLEQPAQLFQGDNNVLPGFFCSAILATQLLVMCLNALVIILNQALPHVRFASESMKEKNGIKYEMWQGEGTNPTCFIGSPCSLCLQITFWSVGCINFALFFQDRMQLQHKIKSPET